MGSVQRTTPYLSIQNYIKLFAKFLHKWKDDAKNDIGLCKSLCHMALSYLNNLSI